MDEGDRSVDDDGSDRETGPVDDTDGSDRETGPVDDTDGSDRETGPVDDTDENGSPAVGSSGDRDTGEGSDGVDIDSGGDDVGEAIPEEDLERKSRTGSEMSPADGVSTPDGEGDRVVDDRIEADRGETEPSRADTPEKGVLYRFRHDREGPLMWIREMLSSVAIVLVIGLILFGVSGVWPPMVAVESGSMEPNMEVGDLVFVTEPGRVAPDAADNDIGVVTHEAGERADYRTFGSYGSVVIYRPPGRTASPIIHRAMFHVEEGENWYDRADDRYHSAADCGDLNHCPAPHDGFITLGDNNGAYDQANGLAAPVRADWVTGVARVRVPYLGYVRLIATGQAEPGDVLGTAVAMRAVQVGSVGVGGVNGGDAPDAKPIVSGGDVAGGVVG